MGRSITVSRRCAWCGDAVKVSLNHDSSERTVAPIVRAFNKVHRKTCGHGRYNMESEVVITTK